MHKILNLLPIYSMVMVTFFTNNLSITLAYAKHMPLRRRLEMESEWKLPDFEENYMQFSFDILHAMTETEAITRKYHPYTDTLKHSRAVYT